MAAAHDFARMLLQQPRVRSCQPVFRQNADHLKQCRAHLVIQIFRRQFSLSALRQAFAHVSREFGHIPLEAFALACWLPRAQDCLAIASLPRNGTLRRRTDSAAGTSFGRIAATCTQPFAATLPSSRSVSHRRNSRNSRGKRASPQIQGTARSTSASIPSHCPLNREPRTRLPLRDARPPVQDPTA